MVPEENISLSKHTTLKIGGPARYFFRVKSIEDLKAVLVFSRDRQLPFFTLGGGSNLLASDEGFSGAVIKNEILGVSFNESGDNFEVTAGAGEPWDAFVSAVVSRGLYGLENLSGIPGTVGASPVQNIGAYGVEVKDTIASVEAFDGSTGETRVFSNSECHFGYRDSFFKTSDGKKYIITAVRFSLKKSGVPNVSYKDLKQIFNFQSPQPGTSFSIFNEKEKAEKLSALTPLEIRKAVLDIRSKKFPDLKTFGTAGSFFKNPIIPLAKFNELKKRFPDLPGFPISGSECSMVKLSLAWILDNLCNLKGYQKGSLSLFKNQPIVIVNAGSASAEEVQALAEEISGCVKEKTAITIEWEVERL